MSNFFGSKYGCQPCRPQAFRVCQPGRWEGNPIKPCEMARHALLLICSQTSNGWVCIAVTLWPDFKWPGVHCCYSMACIAVTPWPDFKWLGVHCCYSVARLQMARRALLLLHGQTHLSPGRYSICFCGVN